MEYLTLYAFSVENWERPKSEVRAPDEVAIRRIKEISNEVG